MQIYKAEKEAGLEELIRSSASIQYDCEVSEAHDNLKDIIRQSDFLKSTAAQDDSDLFHVFSVLVSTGWNLNDDIFDKEEVWLARKTPEHKQTNIGHNDDKIVGHIIGNWAVDKEYNAIADSILLDELPDPFHLITSSVIYLQRQNPATKAEVEKLIQEIRSGNKFVSMECMFHGFDYGVISPKDERHIIVRNSETAFLTSHLKVYGGSGVYDNYKVGRLLRRITFSGKGFVDKPANPNSIIFRGDKLNFGSANHFNPFVVGKEIQIRVSNSTIKPEFKESESMADVSTGLEDQVKELKASVKELQGENTSLKDTISKANVQGLETQISELKTKNSELQNDLSVANQTISQSNAKVAELEGKIGELSKANADLTANLTKANQQIIRSKRLAILMAGNFDQAEAEKKVDLYANLNDEQFADIASVIIKAFSTTPEKSGGSDCMDDEEKEKEEAEDKSLLSTAKADQQPDLAVAGASNNDEQLQATRASLRKWVNTKVFSMESE